MPIPRRYRKGDGDSIASYDYTDIDANTGYVAYRGFAALSGASLLYSLAKEQIECGGKTNNLTGSTDERRSILTSTSGNYTFTASSFKTPRIIEGDSFITFTVHTTTGAGGNDYDWSTSGAVILNNTELNGTSGSVILGATNDPKTYSLRINLPKTNVKIGDVLKVRVGGKVMNSGSAARLLFWHDSLNRNTAGGTLTGSLGDAPAITAANNPTEIRAYIPFKIDL